MCHRWSSEVVKEGFIPSLRHWVSLLGFPLLGLRLVGYFVPITSAVPQTDCVGASAIDFGIFCL